MTCSLSRRSVGAEVNYAIRFTDDADAERFIEKLSEEVEKRMANLGVQGRSLTFKLMRRKVIPEAQDQAIIVCLPMSCWRPIMLSLFVPFRLVLQQNLTSSLDMVPATA